MAFQFGFGDDDEEDAAAVVHSATSADAAPAAEELSRPVVEHSLQELVSRSGIPIRAFIFGLHNAQEFAVPLTAIQRTYNPR